MLQRSFRLALLACFLVQGVAAAALEVRGRVVDEEGRPVSRAKVLLSRVAPQHQSFRDVLGGRLEAEAVETAKTSKDGRYSLSAPEPGMWQVTVHARGKIPIRRRLTPLVDHVDLEDAEVRVDAGLEVLVVAENGDPVPRAQVWIRSIEGRPGRSRARRSQWRDRGRFAMTGEDGRAHLSRPRGESQRARAWASGFLISEEGEAVDGSSGTLTLQRGWRARVRFSRGKDEPMADTILVVQNETSTWIAGVTDAEGRAEFALQPGRPLAIGLRSADGSRFGAALERTAYELENPPLRPETIVVPPAVELTGRVIDNKKREPVAGAFVWPAGDEGHFARTDTEGGYKIAIGAGESRRLGAGAAGYKGNFAPVERDETPPRGPTLALAPAASLEGRVVDEEGNGVGGAQVAAVQAGRWRSPKTQTRADGSFRLTELEPEGAYELVASAPGFAPTGKAVRLEPELMIEIVMLPGRALTGRVVDEGKAPIPGAEILLLPVATDFRQRVRGNNTAGPPPSATTDTDGAFRIDGLGDEPVAVVARNAGFATRMITGFDTESEQPVIDVGEVVLSPGEEIHGVVRRSSGAAIEGARVNASSGSMKQYMIPWELTDDLDQTVATGPDGSFVLSDLSAAEPQTVSASHDDYLNERVEGVLPGSEEPIEIVLDRAGRLSGRVLNEQGEPIDDATVRARALESRDGLTARWAGRDWARGRSREDGSFTVTGVYPGRLEITVEARGYRGTDALELELAKGEERTGLNLVVRRGGTLVGSVRDEEGQPVVGAWVNAEPQRTGPMPSRGRASTRSDGEGRFALDGLDSSVGQLEFSISHPDYVAHKEQLSFSPGMRRDVVLESGVAISGFVLSQAGDPISGAEVSVAQSRYSYGGTGQSQSLEDGSFELRGVGPGTYRLRASKTGFAVTTTETSFEVAAVPVRGVTIHLKTGGTIRGRISGLEPADLAEVQVHVRGAEQGTPAFGLVDPEGEYRVVDVGFERGTVFANSAATGQTVQEAFSLDTEGGETRVDLEFRHGAVLSGLVLLDSEPWRGARVGVDGGPASQAYGQVDHDGRFEVRGLSEGPHRLTVTGDRGGNYTERVDIAGDTEVTIDIQGTTVSGVVLDADTNEPIADATVLAEDDEQPSVWGPAGSQTTTSARGEFELKLSAGRGYTLRAGAVGYVEKSTHVVAEPGVVKSVTLALPSADILEVKVRLWTGVQPPWASFGVLDGQRRVWAGWSRAVKGVYRLTSVPPGEWTLLVQGEGSAITSVPVSVPGPPLEITLPQESRVFVDLSGIGDKAGAGSLRVLAPDGTPLLRPDRDLGDTWRTMGQSAILNAIPAGPWIVEYKDLSGSVWRQPVNARSGETVEVVLE